MNSNQCVICIAPDSELVNAKVAKHDMTDKEAAEHYGVTLRIWAAHYESHVLRKLVNALSTDIVPLKEIVIEKTHIVAESCDRLRKIVLQMSEKILTDEETDSKDILAMGQMERNLAQTVKDLAQLQGELNSGDTINIQNNIVKAEQLTNVMMENACSACKGLFLKKLETITDAK
jgi:hypothetical protein